MLLRMQITVRTPLRNSNFDHSLIPLPAPIQNLIKYQNQYFNLTFGKYSPYTKPPSPEVETAWKRSQHPPEKVCYSLPCLGASANKIQWGLSLWKKKSYRG